MKSQGVGGSGACLWEVAEMEGAKKKGISEKRVKKLSLPKIPTG